MIQANRASELTAQARAEALQVARNHVAHELERIENSIRVQASQGAHKTWRNIGFKPFDNDFVRRLENDALVDLVVVELNRAGYHTEVQDANTHYHTGKHIEIWWSSGGKEKGIIDDVHA